MLVVESFLSTSNDCDLNLLCMSIIPIFLLTLDWLYYVQGETVNT